MEAQGLSLAIAVDDEEGLADVGHNPEVQGYQEDEHSPSSSGGGQDEEEEDDDGEGDEAIAQFLEAEVMDGAEEDEEIALPSKKRRTEDPVPIESIESGEFGKIPPELFPNILKFLSSEDLSSCARVCQYLRRAASDEPLWMRLYCLRWGLPGNKNRVEWKQLYFERDKADMVACLRNSPTEFREYYMQMQVAKRSQAPTISQLKDDLWVAEQSVADQVTAWRRSRRLADIYVGTHSCSGKTCSYHQIGDVYICEKTGCAHVCGDACRETVIDPDPNCFPVCTVSGRCFDRCTFPVEEEDEENGPQQAANEEGEPMLFDGRLGRAYLLGYSCVDDREFERALRDVVYCT